MQTISSQDFIEILQNPSADSTDLPVLIDVRSEGEFEEGSLPFSVNIPILNNHHRHLVGLCYKQEGNAEAVKLGYELVNPIKDKLIAQWKDALEAHKSNSFGPFVYCWRGGQRSEIAAQWMQQSGLSVCKIVGGYKSIRNRLISTFAERAVAETGAKSYNLILLSGMTGAGKTEVLRLLPRESVIDLEGFAHHRGSSFGGYINERQHSQQDFENLLGLKLYQAKNTFLVEAESRNIGRCVLPDTFHKRMKESPMVFLETSLEERAGRIAKEYVGSALSKGVSYLEIQSAMEESLLRVKQKLGGVCYSKTLELLRMAFSAEYQLGNHIPWVQTMLEEYYDKLYLHSTSRDNHKILFQGNREEILDWAKKELEIT